MSPVRSALVLLTLLLALPATAQAKNVYVSGTGTDSDSCLDGASACTLEKALGLAINGDTVVVDASRPVVINDTVASNHAISIRSADPSGAKPIVEGAPLLPGAALISLNAPGSSISGLDIRNTALAGSAGAAVMLRGDGTILQDSIVTSAGTALASQQSAPVVRRVIIRGGTGGADLAASEADPATIVNSVITTTADDAVGLANGKGGEVRAVNVTILAPGPSATGVRAYASAIPGVAGSQITLRNAIVRSGADELVASVAICAPLCGDGSVSVDHSNFAVATGPVIEGAGNVDVDPVFVSETDLHLDKTSPMRDIGVDDPLIEAPLGQPVDLDGAPRKDGAGVDIGAYEYLIPLPPKNPLPPDSGPAVPKDLTAPTLGVLRLSSRSFRAGSKATALSAARRRSPVGTTVTTGVTERSTVLFEIDRIVTGRKSAGDCVKVKAGALRRLKARQRCRLALPVEPGLERVAVKPGRLTFAFSGRVGTQALPAGPYRMVAIATDAAGNRSAPQRTTFTILAAKKSRKHSAR